MGVKLWGESLESYKEDLLVQFEAFLEQGMQGIHMPEEEGATEPEGRGADLYRVFVELAALKAEVKKEARQQKEALGHFNSLLETLQENNRQLTQELGSQHEARQDAVIQAQRGLLEEVIDLQDRLQATMASIRDFKPPLWERRASREFRSGLREGMEITVRRIGQLLSSQGVSPLSTIGKPLDPHTMRVMEVREDQGQADGIVLEEIRRGYLHNDRLFRLAEVVANRHGDIKAER
jgi:molecular chaperone GrpE